MMPTFGQKLIWQPNSPAPYESSWSLFAKLMASNVMKPKDIKQTFTLKSDNLGRLPYWKSSWIDFSKFSKVLGVEAYRLKQCFLYQMCEELTDVSDVRFCNECLKLGYHCVFFQLRFLTHCPWHKLELSEPCTFCRDSVYKSGLKKTEFNEETKRYSSCGHISYIDYQSGIFDKLTTYDKFCITHSCIEFLKWIKTVSASPEAIELLNNVTSDITLLNNSMYLQAAESIAGKSPWYIATPRANIKYLFWEPSAEHYRFSVQTGARKSINDLCYRSVRRHLFKKYVKPHRTCWNVLSNTNFIESQMLNSNRACTVALAFATWRLSIENFLNIEALKSNKFSNKPISILENPHTRYQASLSETCFLLYAYFFYIWEDIQLVAGKFRYSIIKSDAQMYASKFALECTSDKWLLLMPNPSILQTKSNLQCFGILKSKDWMKAKDLTNTDWREFEANETRTLFRLEIALEACNYVFLRV